MKKSICVAVLLFLFVAFVPLNAQWVKIYGEDDEEVAFSLHETSDGDFIVAGGKLTGDSYFRIFKLDVNGAIEWRHECYSNNLISSFYFHQTSDGGYIYGCNGSSLGATGYQDAIWIIKLRSGGDIEWTDSFARVITDYALFMQQTSDGGYILAGNTSGAGTQDIWASKLTQSGDIEWQRTYGGSNIDRACSIYQTSDGGYILAGNTRSFGAGENDIWILKMTSLGNVEWQKTYGGIQNDSVYSIQQTSDGGYIIGGNTSSFGAGGEDVWIIKLTQSGDIEWQRTYGGNDDESSCFIQQANDDGYIIGSTTLSFGLGEKDVLIFKLSPLGNIEWQKTFGTYSNEVTNSILQLSDGSYIAAGSISSFGSGFKDFLVVKLLSDGYIDLSCRLIQEPNVEVSDTIINPADSGGTVGGTNIILDYIPITYFYVGLNDAIGYELCSNRPLLAIHAGMGGTTNPLPGTYAYDIGTGVGVTAIPDTSYEFSEWSGDITDTNNPITITMDEDKSVSSNFIRTVNEYYLSLTGGEGGTTNPEPGTYNYEAGSEITITALPDGGYQFNEWSGDVTGTENPVTITLDSNKSVTANFTEISDEGGDIFRMNCFIATSAYGSPLHPHVKVLRDFRDEYLMRSKFGRTFVDLYYRYSPRIAGFISKHKPLKVAVRLHLLPLVVFSLSIVHLGPVMTVAILIFIFMLPVLMTFFHKRKQDRE